MVYCTVSQVRAKSGLTTTEITDDAIEELIPFADSEIDNVSGQRYGNAVTATEYHTLYLPKRADDILPNRITLKHYPVQSITSFTLINTSNTAYTTLGTLTSVQIAAGTYLNSDYYCEPSTGIIELNTKAFDFVPMRAKVVYTYGYSEIPQIISELSANLTAVRCWVKFMGGQYNRINSYSLPEQTYNKGDFYDRGLKMISELKTQSEEIFNQFIRKQKSQFLATSGGYF